VRKSGGLDVEAAGRREKVQKGFAEAADWTLKRREARRKSKRDLQKRREGGKKSKRSEKERRIGR